MRLLYSILILSALHQTLAHEVKITCSKIIESTGTQEAEALHAHVTAALMTKAWHAVSDDMVAQANCRPMLPSLDEMVKFIKANQEDNSGGNIGSIHLPGEDKDLVEHLKEMLISKYSSLDISKFESCKSVICLSKAVFGKERGIKFLYLKVKYGINPSPHVFKDARAWEPKEIDPFIKGILAYPEHLRGLTNNKAFVHDSSSDGNTLGNSYMRFFGGADTLSDESKEYTAFHEFAHYISSELNIDRKQDWLKLSNWEVVPHRKLEIVESMKKGPEENEFVIPDLTIDLSPRLDPNLGGFEQVRLPEQEDFMERINKESIDMLTHYTAMESRSPNKIISQYGHMNPSEDFAESMSAYRYNPNKLLKTNPEKYNFLKNKVFKGIEFLNDNYCR